MRQLAIFAKQKCFCFRLGLLNISLLIAISEFSAFNSHSLKKDFQ